MNKTLFILQGCAGSGKTTLAKKMVAEGKAEGYAEADTWMTNEKGDYCFDPQKLGYCHKMCHDLVELAMLGERNFIQANTNLRRRDVNTYINLAEKYNYKVVIIKLNSFFGSIHSVAPDKIAAMKSQMDSFDWNNLPDFVTVEEYP